MILVASASLALARPGFLDTSFGGSGVVTTLPALGAPATAQSTGLAIQPDGKIVAAGDAFNGRTEVDSVVRYDADGSLDSSFGSGGVVTTLVEVFSETFAMAIQPDGKIVTAGAAADNVVP